MCPQCRPCRGPGSSRTGRQPVQYAYPAAVLPLPDESG